MSFSCKLGGPFWDQAHENWHSDTKGLDHIVSSLDKVRYDDHHCLVALSKQQIKWFKKSKKQLENSEMDIGQLRSDCRFVQNIERNCCFLMMGGQRWYKQTVTTSTCIDYEGW